MNKVQDVADKAEETIADLDTPIEKNTQLEKEVSQAEVELDSQQEEKIETPEDGEARTEIEEKKALDSTEEEQDLPEETEKVTIAEEKQEAFPQQKPTTKEPLLLSQSLESPYIPDQAPKSTDRWKEQALDFWSWLVEAIKSPTSSLEQVAHTVTQPFFCSFCFLHLPFSLVSTTSNMLTMEI